MKLFKCFQLLAAIVIVILLPTSDAGKKKIQFKKVYSSALPVNSGPQPTISRQPSPTRPNPGSLEFTGTKSVTPKNSFHLPGAFGHNSVDIRKHDDFPALDGNHGRKVDQHTRLSPLPQRKSPLSPETESILSNNPFARLPGAQKSSNHVNQPKQPEEFPPLDGSGERLNANRNPALPGSSHHAEASNKKSLKSPEAQRKFSLQDYPALPSSSLSKNPSSRPSLESLANSQSKSSLEQISALSGSSNHAEAFNKKSLESPEAQRKFSFQDYPALPGSSHSKNPGSRPSLESLTPQTKSSLNQMPDLPGSSSYDKVPNKKLLRSPEAQKKFSLQDYPALPGSSHFKNPSLESLTNSQSKLSLDQFPPLHGSSSSLHLLKNSPGTSPNSKKKISLEEYPALGAPRSLLKSGQYPVERSSSLTLNSQSASNQAAFSRGNSIDSTKNFLSQFNSPLNSPLQKNKNFFGSSSSSGLGTSHHSTSSGSFNSLNAGLGSPGMGRGRKLSDVSLVPQKPIAVSDKTCKDDNSPAEQCFNYFTFSLFWPPALGYEYKTNNKPINDNVNVARWSIHGLWPASYSGITPENCHKRTSVTFNQHRLDREKGLKPNLESKWINICPYKQRGSSLVSFWDREFKTHGACATRSPLIGSDVGYFKMAVSLSNSVNLDVVLSNIGLNPGKIMTYGDIVEKISARIGTTVRVEIVNNKKTNEYYLKEIRVCYDLNFHRINCPGKKLLLQEIRDVNIRHLDYVPAA